jgi:hypothetical protein
MMQLSTKSPVSFGQRRHALSLAAYAVRQQATRSDGDFITWRLSRLMREAETDAQVNIAERQYDVWLRSLAP